MSSIAYEHGKKCALLKLGMLGTMLGGAALGGAAGYAMAPQDREGVGALYGAGLGALGAGAGSKLAPFLHDAQSAKNPLAQAAMPAAGAGLGALTGIGISNALIDKSKPDSSEDPYRYYPR